MAIIWCNRGQFQKSLTKMKTESWIIEWIFLNFLIFRPSLHNGENDDHGNRKNPWNTFNGHPMEI
jgi:hypothetical protein